ncbi:MAG: hypothetical protein VX904_10450, partial [Planctomycetota bacterium]|nr:hypothetical protein [Planctomycetota bacterium]
PTSPVQSRAEVATAYGVGSSILVYPLTKVGAVVGPVFLITPTAAQGEIQLSAQNDRSTQ